MGVNIVLLGGRLTKDPDIRHTVTRNNEPLTFANFTIAVSRDRKGPDGTYPTDFHFCKAIGQTADFIEKYFSRGSEILVQGKLDDDKYTNKNGQEVYQKIVEVSQVNFMGSASGGGRQPEQAQQLPNPPDSFQPVAEQAVQQAPVQQAQQPVQNFQPDPVVMAGAVAQTEAQAWQPVEASPVQTEAAPVQQAQQPVQQAQPTQQSHSTQPHGAPPFGSALTFGGGYGNGYNGQQ